jgi:hypothetical protein
MRLFLVILDGVKTVSAIIDSSAVNHISTSIRHVSALSCSCIPGRRKAFFVPTVCGARKRYIIKYFVELVQPSVSQNRCYKNGNRQTKEHTRIDKERH